MATFYVLPPRSCLEDSLGGLIGKLLPGLPLPVDAWDAVVERLADLGGWPTDVYLIPRDDLSPGESVADSLIHDFGAEAGDRVIDVALNGSRSTTLGGVPIPALAR
ncbi:MAG TPA: hypothetical protein VN641_08545 [Urbifossiella sp.]|nr:hypothetical protein [Urbifossiella sp.]